MELGGAGWGGGECLMGIGFLLGVMKLTVLMVAQLCEYIGNH